jgi:hypothetical protein
MKTRIEWGVPDEHWADFLANCPDATFFHGPGWYRTWQDAAGFRPDCARIAFASGEEALLPLAVTPKFRGLVREAHAGLGAAYGGLVTPAPLTTAQAEEAFRLVREKYPDLVITGNPHAKGPHMPAGGRTGHDDTLCVPLLEPEARRKAMTDSRRKSLRQAEKVGYVLEVLEGPTEADLEKFYPLYAAHAASWAYTRWKHDARYFRALLRHCGRDLVLFRALHDGELAGFRLVAARGRVAMALHLARAEAYEKRHVSPWLVGASLDWLYDRELAACDFMPSGRLEGVRAYKASFGAEARPYSTAAFEGTVNGTLGRIWQLTRGRRAA